MRQEITESQFVDEIVGDEYNSMSYEGARALYEYLEEMEDNGGEEMSFCKADIRCQYTEYENIEEVQEDYNDIKTLADLTQVIFVYTGIVNKYIIVFHFINGLPKTQTFLVKYICYLC